jgi:tetratricopeptide (TPR) repeat protein
LDYRSTASEPTFKDDVAALESEATNIQPILLEAAAQITELARSRDPSVSDEELSARADTLLDVLLVFAWYQRWSKGSADIAERSVTVARVMKKEHWLAHALFCLASILAATVHNSDACKHFEEARKYFRNLSEGPDLRGSGHSALELASNYQYMSKPSNVVEKFVLEAQNDFREEGSVYTVTLGLLALGYFYWYRGDYDNGLEQLEAARTAFEGISRPVDVARCLFEASRCHAGKGSYSKALDAINDALQAYEHIGLPREVCEALVLMARYLKMLDRGDQALEILRRCLEQCQSFGGPLLIAQTLEEFGAIYSQKGDHRAARVAYEGAQEQFESIPGTFLGQEGAARCQHNLLQLLQFGENSADNNLQFQHATRY